jgi:hypothetical protein
MGRNSGSGTSRYVPLAGKPSVAVYCMITWKWRLLGSGYPPYSSSSSNTSTFQTAMTKARPALIKKKAKRPSQEGLKIEDL